MTNHETIVANVLKAKEFSSVNFLEAQLSAIQVLFGTVFMLHS